jgi:hypothetical protein
MQKSREQVNIELSFSKWLFGYSLTIYTLMTFTCVNLFKGPENVLAITALVIHGLWEIRKTGWLNSDTGINRLILSEDGDVVVFQSGHKAYFRLVRSYACNWFVILTLKSSETNRVKRIFISFDAVDNDGFRTLNILLKRPTLYLQ